MKPLLFLFVLGAATAWAQKPTLELDLGNGVRMEMILVNPGSFMQGSPAGEAGREADEGPQRRVTISRAYYMGKHPVTHGQYERFVEVTGYRTEAEKGESGGYGAVGGRLVQQKQFTWRNPGFPTSEGQPVTLVTVADAAAFCQWLTRETDYLCELPTEAQWEHACRAGGSLAHYSEPIDAISWHRGNSGGTAHAVGEKRANGWGFHDFYGPVWQWCRDWYGPYPAGNATDPLQTNPNLSDKPRQVLRGGSFLSDVSHARSAARYRNDARSRNADNGFRIVCAVTQRLAPPTGAMPAPPTRPLAGPHAARDLDEPLESVPNVFGWIMALFGTVVPLLAGFFILRAIFRQIKSRMMVGTTAAGTAASSLTGAEAAALFAAKPAPMTHRFAFRLTDDGFYITGPAEASGAALAYECTVGDRVISNDIIFTPGPEGHFIFTGKRPSNLRVQTLGGAAGTESSPTAFSSDDDDFHRRHMSSSSSSSSSRYPSAY